MSAEMIDDRWLLLERHYLDHASDDCERCDEYARELRERLNTPCVCGHGLIWLRDHWAHRSDSMLDDDHEPRPKETADG